MLDNFSNTFQLEKLANMQRDNLIYFFLCYIASKGLTMFKKFFIVIVKKTKRKNAHR